MFSFQKEHTLLTQILAIVLHESGKGLFSRDESVQSNFEWADLYQYIQHKNFGDQ